MSKPRSPFEQPISTATDALASIELLRSVDRQLLAVIDSLDEEWKRLRPQRYVEVTGEPLAAWDTGAHIERARGVVAHAIIETQRLAELLGVPPGEPPSPYIPRVRRRIARLATFGSLSALEKISVSLYEAENVRAWVNAVFERARAAWGVGEVCVALQNPISTALDRYQQRHVALRDRTLGISWLWVLLALAIGAILRLL